MDIDRIFQTALYSKSDNHNKDKTWKVILRLPAKTIRFSLDSKECQEKRTVSWLNSPPKTDISENYRRPYEGYRRLKDVEIALDEKMVLNYDNYFLNINEVIFGHDEFFKMGDESQAKQYNNNRITPDGVEIFTKAIGDTIFQLNGHIYNFNSAINKHHFIPMTNVLIRKFGTDKEGAEQVSTKYSPFLALNREFIEGFAVLFKGSTGRN